MKIEGLERNRPRSARRLASVTLAWLAAAGLLSGTLVLTAHRGVRERAIAAPPCVDRPDGVSLTACYGCLRCTPMRLPPYGYYLIGHYPGQRGQPLPLVIRLCDTCASQLDPLSKQRALENWIDAEVKRVRGMQQDLRRPTGNIDRLCARIRQAQLDTPEPDP